MSKYDIPQAEVEVLTGLKAIELLKPFLNSNRVCTFIMLDDGRLLKIKRPWFDDSEMRGRFV